MAGSPEPAGGSHTVLVWLGRLLPRDFVQRVVEPAWEDERTVWLGAGREPFLARTRFFVSCLWVGIPGVFWRAGRPTRTTMLMAGSAVVVIVALLWLAPMLYRPYPPLN